MEESAMDHAAISSSSAAASDDHFAPVVKGKRTKRQRAPASSSSSSVELSSTTTTAVTREEEEEEEEGMVANCLILLAQGRSLDPAVPPPEKKTAAPNGKTATGEFVYQCKTCDKCFPSFQALGGHRTSHKKPKTVAAAPLLNGEKKTTVSDEDGGSAATSPIPKPAPMTTATIGKPRMHECSICGSEFSSGQALGGHMRRHRPIPAAAEPPKEKNVFVLDLNLPPAPSDDDAKSPPPAAAVFPFESQPPMWITITN